MWQIPSMIPRADHLVSMTVSIGRVDELRLVTAPFFRRFLASPSPLSIGARAPPAVGAPDGPTGRSQPTGPVQADGTGSGPEDFERFHTAFIRTGRRIPRRRRNPVQVPTVPAAMAASKRPEGSGTAANVNVS